MNKYTFTLGREIELRLDDDYDLSIETKIADLFSDSFNDVSWIYAVINLELIYSINIPNSLVAQKELTIAEFGEKLAELPIIPNAIYPEYYELKIQMLADATRLGTIENSHEEGTQEELIEIRERLMNIEQRLKQITEFPLN